MLAQDLLFAIVICVANRNLPAGTGNREIAWILEGWSFLHKVIGDKPELAALRKNCGLVLSK
jgi:hypothetical protein